VDHLLCQHHFQRNRRDWQRQGVLLPRSYCMVILLRTPGCELLDPRSITAAYLRVHFYKFNHACTGSSGRGMVPRQLLSRGSSSTVSRGTAASQQPESHAGEARLRVNQGPERRVHVRLGLQGARHHHRRQRQPELRHPGKCSSSHVGDDTASGQTGTLGEAHVGTHVGTHGYTHIGTLYNAVEFSASIPPE
jgi:hypothetical protein